MQERPHEKNGNFALSNHLKLRAGGPSLYITAGEARGQALLST